MALVKPFRGFLYNQERIEDFELVVAPPYDVITAEQQSSYYEKHPCNIIRLILGKVEPSDDEANNRYTRAARHLSRWQEDSTLVRSEKPSIYFYRQDYVLPTGEARQRKGFICLFGLEEFSSGVIKPHERTLSKPKADRLNLTKACRANFNPVFSLYSDPELTVEEFSDSVATGPAYLDVSDENGVRHQLWVVDSPDILESVQKVMESKSLLIADGHHRYETALNYRKLMRDKHAGATGEEAFNYTMMYFTNMNDVGLVILPYHRLVKGINFKFDAFVETARKYFDVETIPTNLENDLQVRRKTLATMKDEATERYAFCMYSQGQDGYSVFRLKDASLLDEVMDTETTPALRSLDANIMEALVFRTLLGISCSDPQHEDKFKFFRDDEEAVGQVRSGTYEVALLVNPTRIEQVKEIVAHDGIMPQKSTFFYPKLLSGLVINQIDPDEKIV